MRTRLQVPRAALDSKTAREAPGRIEPGLTPAPRLALDKSGPLKAPSASASSTTDLRLAPVHGPGAVPEKPGLPENLRAGVERLSRLALGDVRVHYDSPEPGRHQALAFTKGRDIHIGPGQEKHLPHEAWHAVQQRQGRVAPTRQVGGDRINDDPALEKEAEVMGSRALSLHAKEPPAAGPALQTGRLAPAVQVMQMKHDVTATDDDLLKLETWNAEHTVYDLVWAPLLEEIYGYIEEVRRELKRPDEKKELEKQEEEVDKLAATLDAKTKDFARAVDALDDADDADDADDVKDDAGYSAREKTRSAKRNRIKDRRATEWDLAPDIDVATQKLASRYSQIWGIFSPAGGGFGAKGRAHAMGESEAAQVNFSKITTWFEGVTLGGARLSDAKAVYKDPARIKVNEKASAPILPSEVARRADNKKLNALEASIGKNLKLEQKETFKRAPRAADRGAGQISNMGGANASAYAELADVPNWAQSRWEWLHVKAASLGGDTDGTNLVVGTRDVNTQMIPFESNIRLLSKVAEQSDSYEKLEANFSVAGQDATARHKVTSINFSWKLFKEDDAPAGVKEIEGQAKFNPLLTDASISKTEVGIIEAALKAEREKVAD